MNDVTFSAGSIVIITALLTALAGTIGVLFRQLIASKDQAFLGIVAAKDATLTDMIGQRNAYQKMAAQSISALELAANRQRKARGEPPIEFVSPVVPEHNSPTTEKQVDVAEYQTLLARANAAAKALDVPLGPTNEEHTVALHPGESVTISAQPPEEELST